MPVLPYLLQVHLHRAIVEQVRVMRKSLRSRSSVGSRASSDWGEMQSPSKTYSWAAGADGTLTPQGETALQHCALFWIGSEAVMITLDDLACL